MINQTKINQTMKLNVLFLFCFKIQRRFIVPATEDQAKIPFGRVNHNKYMVTDNTAYIGTSNWSADYFINTAGIGLVLKETLQADQNDTTVTIRSDLASIFERDWNSAYAVELKTLS